MAKDVIIACDFAGRKETLDFLDAFRGEAAPFVKIGMELFYAEGPEMVRELKRRSRLPIVDDPTAVKPRLITIGDSFYWNILNHAPFKRIFGSVPYWYYFSTIYFDGPEVNVADIDLLEKVTGADFIMLAYSTPQQYEMSNGFAQRFLMEWCYDKEEIEPLKQKMKERISHDTPWMDGIIKKAENMGVSVDSMLNMETSYFITKRPDACFPALGDSVPLKRSSKAEQIITQKSHTNE